MSETLWDRYRRTVARWTGDQSETNGQAMVAAYGDWVRSFCPTYADQGIQNLRQKVENASAA